MAAATVGFSTAGCIFAVCAAVLTRRGCRAFTGSVRAFVSHVCIIHLLSPPQTALENRSV